MMSHAVILAGFVATVVLTTSMAVTTGLGWSRMNLPLVLGTVLTPDRERAMFFGVGINLAGGWIFSLIYAGLLRHHDVLAGIGLGALQGLFVVAVLLPLLPAVHPRMASETDGPTPQRKLEPPGFLGRNYGRWTPHTILVAHILYGAVLGWLL